MTSRTLSFSELPVLLGGAPLGDSPSGELLGVSDSSALVKEGQIFVAVSGSVHDGHDHIEEAEQKGAAALVIEKDSGKSTFPRVLVPNSRLALAKLADYFSGAPSKRCQIAAVTGTNGKTSTVSHLYYLLSLLDKRVMRIGTLGMESNVGGLSRPGNLTTPGALEIHHLLAEGVDQGVNTVVLEASSHALVQHRLGAIDFDVAVFTNLSRDHLDFHKTMENYFEAKWLLFSALEQSSKPSRAAVVGVDDEWGREIARRLVSSSVSVITYGRNPEASITIAGVTPERAGSEILWEYDQKLYKSNLPLLGEFNVQNAAAAAGVLLSWGVPAGKVFSLLSELPPVPGRLEPIQGDDLMAVVDFAHTPDALSKVLQAVKPLTEGKLWALFGCGGNRDRGKRALMGKAARELADKVVLTSDNPRNENPQQIIEDILESGVEPVFIESDRAAAIHQAVAEAQPGDTLVLAGKGHEQYQVIGSEKIPFSDQETVKAAFAARKARL